MWYDRSSDSVRSAIDGNVVTLAPAFNASRIVSYVVIRTQRYDDRALLDMRVLEINVVASVRATPPWMPVTPPDEEPQNLNGFDGTANSASAEDRNRAATVLSLAISFMNIFWAGPWPELHYQFNATSVQGEVRVHEDVRTNVHVKYSLLHEATVLQLDTTSEMTTIFNSFWDEVWDIMTEFVLLTATLHIALWAWRTFELGIGGWVVPFAIAVVFTELAICVPFAIAAGWDVGIDLGWLAAVLIFQALLLFYVAFGNVVAYYLWMIIAGLAGRWLGYPLFAAYTALQSCMEGSILARGVAFMIGIAYILIASGILTKGGPIYSGSD